MLEVSRERVVPATAEQVWADLVDGDRFAEWYAFCDAVEVLEPGVRILKGSWGARRSAVTTRFVVEDRPSRLVWRHESETLDDEPAPGMAMETVVEITLRPVEGGTEVRITSSQEAAGRLQGLAIRVLGKRQVGNMLEQSLTVLAARHTPRD